MLLDKFNRLIGTIMKTLTSTLLSLVTFIATFSVSAADLVKPESIDMTALKLEVQKNLQIEKQDINALLEVKVHQQINMTALLEKEQRERMKGEEKLVTIALAD